MPSFACHLEEYGEHPALVCEDGVAISHVELAARADAFAATLTRAGPLLLEANNSIEAVVAYIAALRHGRPVILTGAGSIDADERILTTFRPAYLFRPKGGAWHLQRGSATPSVSHPDLAVLLSTSGSTGSPKLVRLSHANIQSNAVAIASYLGIGQSDRAITSLPFHYSYGMSVVNAHLAVGGSVVLTNCPLVDPAFLDLLEGSGATSLAGVPDSYAVLDRIGFRERAPASLRVLTQAGGKMPADRVADYARWAQARDIRFFVMYGQTEASPRIAYVPPHLLADHPHCIGVPIPGGALRVIDANGRECAEGVEGELVYSGPNVMMGYAESADDLALPKQCHELRTGDLGVKEQGLFRIVGRRSRFSKLFGLRLSLDEMEDELHRHGIAARVAGDDRRIALCVTEGRADEAANLLAQRYRLPLNVFAAFQAAEAPVLPNGKPDYMAVLAGGADGDQAAGRDIAAAMSAILGRPVSPDDSFASLGGDSLSYVQMAMEVERLTGLLPVGWEAMPLRRLERLSAGVSPRRSFWRAIDTEVVIRMLAILGVVSSHADPARPAPAPGGAVVLFMLAGYSLARFNGARLLAGDIWPVIRNFAFRILIPYYVLFAVMLALSRATRFSWSGLLLYANFEALPPGVLFAYWFIHVLAQSLLLFCIPFLFPSFRRMAREMPWKAGTTLLGVALVLKFAAAALWSHAIVEYRTPDALIYVLVFGWLLPHADTRARRMFVVACATLLSIHDFGPGDLHVAWMFGATTLILFMPRMKLPRPVYLAVVATGAASFSIYLTHMFAIQAIHYEMGVKGYLAPIGAAVLLGVSFERLWAKAMVWTKWPSAHFKRSRWWGARFRRHTLPG